MHDPVELNFVVLPDLSTSQKAISLSHGVAETIPTAFILNETQFKPHITIYQGIYPKKNLSHLVSSLRTIAEEISAFDVKLEGFEVVAMTYLFWNAIKSSELVGLHDQALKVASPLREGLLTASALDLLSVASDDEKKVIQETGGLLNTKSRYHPHITITRLQDTRDSQAAVDHLKDTPGLSFKADRLCLAVTSIHGTISDIVEEFRLKN